MRTFLLLASLAVGLGHLDAPAAETPVSEAELNRWVPGLLRATSVPGLSMAVVRNGELRLTAAYGVTDATTGKPVRRDTVFEAASLSKPVFACGVLLLAREGRLDLDASLTRYIDRPYVANDPRLERITARLVLSHSSGFPNWRPGRWTESPEPLTIDFDPGTRFGYSGEGYEYLRVAVESITGLSIESYLQEAVLRPLGMRDSSYVWRESYEGKAATGHDRAGEPKTLSKPEAANAAASLHTTAEDYARFLVALLGSEFAEVARAMTSPRTEIEDHLGWGLGLGVETTAAGVSFWQWGDNGAFKAFVMGSRERGDAVVVFTNGENGLRVCQAVVRALLGPDHPALDFRMLSY